MKKFLLAVLLSFFILLPQASAETLVDVSAEELYQRSAQICASLDEENKMSISDLALAEAPSIYQFYFKKGDTVAMVVLECNEDGKIERTNCIGSVENDEYMKTLFLSSAVVMQAVGLSGDEWNFLTDGKNQVRDENSYSSTVFVKALNKDVVMLTMTMGKGIVGTRLSVK